MDRWRSLMSFPRMDEDFWSLDLPSTPSGLSVSEDDKHVYVEAHLPGLAAENIEVTFDKGELWIHGEKKEEQEDKKKKFYKKASSSFSYRLKVPGAIDETKEPEATYQDGVMKVSFVKRAGSSDAKKIRVKSK